MSASPTSADHLVEFRPVTEDDLARLLELNNRATPAVPEHSEEEFSELWRMMDYSVAVWSNESVVGFLWAVEPGSSYTSENYRFFEEQGFPHLYIDRIVVDDSARGQGLGTSLYEHVFDEARRRGFTAVTCEVNLEPPNPGSLSFHHRMGFDDYAIQSTKGGQVVVQLLRATLAPGGER